MVLGNIANSIFGTPNRDKAMAQQGAIMHDYYGRLARSQNYGTTGKIMQELAIRNHGKAIDRQNRKAIHAQNQYYKTTESGAILGATKVFVPIGGQSRTAGRNQDLMLLSQLDKAEDVVRYTKGEGASLNANAALQQFQSDFGKANATIAKGMSGARRGVTYTDDTAGNIMKLGKLAISAATGTPPIGMFGQFSGEGGGNASFWQMMTKQTV